MVLEFIFQTKTKYCFLVKRLGWKPSSAAKLLKIKTSTAKMILKNFQHEDFDDLGQKLKGKYCKKKTRGQKQEKMSTEVAKVEENEQMICFFVYFGLDPVMMYQQTWQ